MYKTKLRDTNAIISRPCLPTDPRLASIHRTPLFQRRRRRRRLFQRDVSSAAQGHNNFGLSLVGETRLSPRIFHLGRVGPIHFTLYNFRGKGDKRKRRKKEKRNGNETWAKLSLSNEFARSRRRLRRKERLHRPRRINFSSSYPNVSISRNVEKFPTRHRTTTCSWRDTSRVKISILHQSSVSPTPINPIDRLKGQGWPDAKLKTEHY